MKSQSRSVQFQSRAAADVHALRARLQEHMDRVGLRSTAQRALVADAFFLARGHVSLDEILASVRQLDPTLGYATVYRTMKLLCESGLATERHFANGQCRYELCFADDHHDHLICTECGRIEEFHDPLIEERQRAVARAEGFELRDHTHELYGVCKGCRKPPPRR